MTADILIKDDRGVATSLLETVLVITIIALLSGIAFVATVGNLEQARMARAAADTEQIGIAIHSFMQDTGFAPGYKAGDARAPDDPVFLILESGGNDPLVEESLNWPTEASDRDLLENQLIKNQPGSGIPYPRMGEISWAKFKGWNGPYMAKVPTWDPWDDKYFVNVQLLTPKGVQMILASETTGLVAGQRTAAFVISAGPNRTLETRFDQPADLFFPGGDDIVFRIQ